MGRTDAGRGSSGLRRGCHYNLGTATKGDAEETFRTCVIDLPRLDPPESDFGQPRATVSGTNSQRPVRTTQVRFSWSSNYRRSSRFSPW